MCGVGIYSHPDVKSSSQCSLPLSHLQSPRWQGDRYEGFFNANKYDGPGSYYERDPVAGKYIATHGVWQAGRRSSSGTTSTPFVPTLADLPDINNQALSLCFLLRTDHSPSTFLNTIYRDYSRSLRIERRRVRATVRQAPRSATKGLLLPSNNVSIVRLMNAFLPLLSFPPSSHCPLHSSLSSHLICSFFLLSSKRSQYFNQSLYSYSPRPFSSPSHSLPPFSIFSL